MFVLLPSAIHKTRKYGTTAWTKQSTTESLSGASKYERGTVPRSHEDISKQILKQGTDLKMSLMEYTFDEAIEKNQEELKWKEEENKK